MMLIRQPRYSREEFTRRGEELYERAIRPHVDSEQNQNKFVALDIKTCAWEMDTEVLAACDRLEARVPDSQTWLVRVGSPYVHRMGGPRWDVEMMRYTGA